jgi:hypothetical protein
VERRLELAAEWSRECGFRAARDAGRAAPEEEVDAAPGRARAAALLARAAALVAARRAAEPSAPAARSCRARFTMKGLLARMKERPFGDDLEQNVMKQAVVYDAYRALSAGDPRPCAELTPVSLAVGVSRTGADRCVELFTDMAGARALDARDPAFVGLCVENARVSYPGLPAEDAAEGCREILAGADDPEALCARLSPRLVPARLKDACVRRYRLFARGAGARDCRALASGPSIVHDQCLDMAAYARARAGGGAAACGGSAVCRLLTGGGKADLAAQRARVAALACRPLPAPASLARVEAVLDQAGAELAGWEGTRAPGDRAGAAAEDALAERAARLRVAAREAFSKPTSEGPSPY